MICTNEELGVYCEGEDAIAVLVYGPFGTIAGYLCWKHRQQWKSFGMGMEVGTGKAREAALRSCCIPLEDLNA